MQMILKLSKIQHDAHKLCCRQDAPLSFFVLIVQAIKNAVDGLLIADNGTFGQIFGPGAVGKVMSDILDCRFSIDDKKPPGCKVALLESITPCGAFSWIHSNMSGVLPSSWMTSLFGILLRR